MAAQIELKSKIGGKSGPCSCGCAPCDETSCGLDCVIQPRYFCGQLLTDADLTAGVTWSQGKFRLARRRDGWGVVCGLDLACGPRPGTVTVHPGYAVDCCGDDIVVCADATLDLNKLFQQAPKKCEPGQKQPEVETGQWIADGDVLAVDIAIHYQEQGILAAATLGRSACGQSGECEYSRVKEGHRLTGKMIRRGDGEIPWGLDPQQVAANNWQSELETRFKPLRTELEQFFPMPQVDQIQPALRRWMGKNPLYQFCSLDGFLTSASPNGWLEDHLGHNRPYPALSEIMFLIVQDGVNRFLARACSTCEDEGVPLGRLWLQASVSLGKIQYDVQHIVSLPPYRREQRPDSLPAPLGQVNLGEVIWRAPADARSILARSGIRLTDNDQPINIPDVGQVFDRFQELSDMLFLDVGKTYDPVVYHDPYGVKHLVGVKPGNP
jgi:hypothetical protein